MNALGSIKYNQTLWESFGGKKETSFGGILDWCYHWIVLAGFISRECNIREQCGFMESSVLVNNAYGQLFFFTCLLNASNQPKCDSTVQMHSMEYS